MNRKLITFLAAILVLLSSTLSPAGLRLTAAQGNGLMRGIQLVESGEDGLVLELAVPEYKLSEIHSSGQAWSQLSVPGGDLTQEPGRPALPSLSVMIGVPAEAQLILEILEDEVSPLPGNLSLAPSLQPAALVEDLQPGAWARPVDPAFVTLDRWYPELPARLEGEAWLRDLRVVRVVFNPFQYNPQPGAVLWHRRMRVAVRFGQADGEAAGQKTAGQAGLSSAFEPALRGAVLNYEQARAWRQAPDAQNILPSSLSAAAPLAGPRYRIGVEQDGLYRLTYADLREAGLPSGVDPHSFHLTNQGEGVAIYVEGEGDYAFNPGDSITFYGQRFRGDRLAERFADENRHWLTYIQQTSGGGSVPWHPAFSATMAEKYTDENVYWLTVGGVPGPRMGTEDGNPQNSTAPTPSSYPETAHAERSLRWWTWHFQGEDTWFWERMQGLNTWTFTTTLTALASGAYTAAVRARVVAASSNDFASGDHVTRFQINDRPEPLDEAAWEGRSSYTFETQVPQSALVVGENALHFTALEGTAVPDVTFDWFEIDYRRIFQAQEGALLFPVEADGPWKYAVTGLLSTPVEIYDVTQPLSPKRILNPAVSGAAGSYTARFVSSAGAGARILALSSAAIKKPESISFYSPPDLRSASNGADYLIISAPQFLPGLQALAEHRAAGGLRTRVIDIRDVYNEFGDGIAHPIAIKSFLAYTFQYWQPPAPSYVLLVGDGHWNPKGFNPARYGNAPVTMLPYLGWVDPWQGEVDATNLLAALVGDDPLPDLHIARLPVNSLAELQAMVDKILAYENRPPRAWQSRLLFVADDTPDEAGDFVLQSEALISSYLSSAWIPGRVYLDNYKDSGSCGTGAPGTCPAANAALREALNGEGALLVTYYGHASLSAWASERIWTNADTGGLANGRQLPVILSMTCWDGYWMGPSGGTTSFGPGLIETMLRADGKGAVAAFAPGGLGVGTGHDALAEGFYEALFEAGAWELGQAALAAKLKLYATGNDFDLLHTFTILGDPALRIASPYNGRLLYLPTVVR